MNYTFNHDRTRLTIHADADERVGFAEMKADNPEDWGSYQTEIAILEPLICNSELNWINPTDTGDLTDAPMIGITGGDDDATRERKGTYGAIHGGSDVGGEFYYPILERWAYMDYQVRSFCDDLLETGEAVFVGGSAQEEPTTNHRVTAHTPADYDAAIIAIMRSDAISGRAYEAALTAIRLAREEAEKHLTNHNAAMIACYGDHGQG